MQAHSQDILFQAVLDQETSRYLWGLTMQAIQFDGTLDNPTFSLADLPIPQPTDGQVLIKIHAAGVIATELGWYPTSHHQNGDPRHHAVPGHEFSGIIASVGKGVTSLNPGQAVYGMNDWFQEGATAEYCVAPASSIALKPATLSHIEAATVPISALTAWQGLFTRAAIQPGERILIQGAAGAVGLFVVQLAHRHGAYVIATASSENIALVQSLGADQVIDYKASAFENGLAPVDVVFDTVGGSIRERSAAVLKPAGRLISIAADGEVNTDPKVRAAYFIVEANHVQLTEVARLLDQSRLKTFVKGVVPLNSASLAYTGAAPKKNLVGKFVVEVSS
jgi:NADPH:quinone reductase-like Zn-dependent oxidoreductase